MKPSNSPAPQLETIRKREVIPVTVAQRLLELTPADWLKVKGRLSVRVSPSGREYASWAEIERFLESQERQDESR